MGFGSMDRRVVISKATDTILPNGERTKVWEAYHTCWAEMMYKAAGEGVETLQIKAQNTVTFRIRYYTGISEDKRLTYDSVVYDIIGVVAEGREKYLTIECKRIE